MNTFINIPHIYDHHAEEASKDSISYLEFQPSANKRKINELKTSNFVERSENVIFIGLPGVGKTHLAVGLALEAIKNGYTAYFLSAHKLISMIRKTSRPAGFFVKSEPYRSPEF